MSDADKIVDALNSFRITMIFLPLLSGMVAMAVGCFLIAIWKKGR